MPLFCFISPFWHRLGLGARTSGHDIRMSRTRPAQIYQTNCSFPPRTPLGLFFIARNFLANSSTYIYVPFSFGAPARQPPPKTAGLFIELSPHVRALFLHFYRLNCRSVNFPQHDKRHEARNESPKH